VIAITGASHWVNEKTVVTQSYAKSVFHNAQRLAAIRSKLNFYIHPGQINMTVMLIALALLVGVVSYVFFLTDRQRKAIDWGFQLPLYLFLISSSSSKN
jgi:hypothetical protein